MRATARAAAALHSTSTQQHCQKGISKDFKNLRNKLKNEPVEAKPNLCILHFAFRLLFPTKNTLSPNSHLLPSLPFIPTPPNPRVGTGSRAEQGTAEQKVASGSKWPMSGGGGGSILLAFSPRPPALWLLQRVGAGGLVLPPSLLGHASLARIWAARARS